MPPQRKRVKHRMSEVILNTLDEGLARWKTRLLEVELDPDEISESQLLSCYKLVFYSDDGAFDTMPIQPSYGGILGECTEWSAKDWLLSKHTLGGNVIAFGHSVRDLLPDSVTGMLLGLCGLTFLICPANLEYPRYKRDFSERDFWYLQAFVYGAVRFVDPLMKKLETVNVAGKKNRNFQDLECIKEVYRHYIERPEKNRLNAVTKNFGNTVAYDAPVEIFSMTEEQLLHYSIFIKGVQSRAWFST